MTELSTQSLAQIVKANHKTAAIFEKYNLDFCCKGKRSLEQACTEKALPVDQIISELQATANSCQVVADFNKMPLIQLADYIVLTHHKYVKEEMPQIFAYLQKIVSKHGDRHSELLKVFEAFTALKEEMEEHMKKEELILFPRIKALKRHTKEKSEWKVEVTYLQAPISMMEEEHDQAGRLLEEIRELTSNFTPPADACTTYRLSFAALQAFELDLHQHVHLENNILFPKTIELFKQINTETLN